MPARAIEAIVGEIPLDEELLTVRAVRRRAQYLVLPALPFTRAEHAARDRRVALEQAEIRGRRAFARRRRQHGRRGGAGRGRLDAGDDVFAKIADGVAPQAVRQELVADALERVGVVEYPQVVFGREPELSLVERDGLEGAPRAIEA